MDAIRAEGEGAVERGQREQHTRGLLEGEAIVSMLPSDGRGGGSKAAALEAADADGKEGSSRRWSPVTCIAPRRSAAAGSPPRAEPGRAAASVLLSPPRPNQGTEQRPEASAGNLGL